MNRTDNRALSGEEVRVWRSEAHQKAGGKAPRAWLEGVARGAVGEDTSEMRAGTGL